MKATIYKTKEAQPRGEYKPTLVDEQKKEARFTVEAICGNRYEIATTGIELKPSRSVQVFQNGWYSVTQKVFNELKGKYNWACNF